MGHLNAHRAVGSGDPDAHARGSARSTDGVCPAGGQEQERSMAGWTRAFRLRGFPDGRVKGYRASVQVTPAADINPPGPA